MKKNTRERTSIYDTDGHFSNCMRCRDIVYAGDCCAHDDFWYKSDHNHPENYGAKCPVCGQWVWGYEESSAAKESH